MIVNGINLPKTSKRLLKLYDEVVSITKKEDTFVDVGSDHGYLSALVCSGQIANNVVATDISAPSLIKTETLAKKYNLNIECIVCDGLTKVQKADVVCICGMGAQEIIKILGQATNLCRFVLQPVQDAAILREYLIKHNYKIEKDYVIADKGKFYFIFVIKGFGKNKYTKKERLLGKFNDKNLDTDFIDFLIGEKNNLKFLENFDITKVSNQSKNQLKQKINYYKLINKLLKGSVYDTRND